MARESVFKKYRQSHSQSGPPIARLEGKCESRSICDGCCSCIRVIESTTDVPRIKHTESRQNDTVESAYFQRASFAFAFANGMANDAMSRTTRALSDNGVVSIWSRQVVNAVSAPPKGKLWLGQARNIEHRNKFIMF